MKNIKNTILDTIVFALVILFVYAGAAKLLDLEGFQIQMSKSPLLPSHMVTALSYFMPIFEFVVALLLILYKTRRAGFYLSFFLMLLFSFYLSVLYFFFPYYEIPCSCGGILGKMSYPVHIVFNLFFTAIALVGCYLQNTLNTAVRS